jgi:peptide chain release factor 2/peptide chain release factor
MSAAVASRAPDRAPAAAAPVLGPHLLQVSAGTGPIEVRRFVALLAERLQERCAELGAVISEVVVRGDEAAPASVEIHLAAAHPAITGLAGTHALVARSPDRGKRSRKRWFAKVTLCAAGAAPERAPAAKIARDDVVITAMRAGGPGGQHVNKTASAVRVFHRPTGVTVRVAEERSQHDNVRVALARLARIVAEREAEKAAGARAGRRLLHYRMERGRPAFVYELSRDGGLSPCEETCSR